MNVPEYMASGILEDYCMGLLPEHEALEVENAALLYPEIKQELELNMMALEQYALSYEREPAVGTKAKIMALINNLQKEEAAMPGSLPLLNRFSSSEKWLDIVVPMLPAATDEDIYVKVLRNDGGIFQAVLWLKSYYPDEVHDKVQECALLLQGECTCYIGDETVNLMPGQFLEIPLNAHHNIKVTNGPVLAIIQRLKVA